MEWFGVVLMAKLLKLLVNLIKKCRIDMNFEGNQTYRSSSLLNISYEQLQFPINPFPSLIQRNLLHPLSQLP